MISDDNIWMARSARRLILMFSHDWTAQSALGESCYSAADDENHDFSEPDMKWDSGDGTCCPGLTVFIVSITVMFMTVNSRMASAVHIMTFVAYAGDAGTTSE